MFDLVATVMSYANATTVLVLVFSFLGAYRWYKRPSRFPPGPRGIPLLGVVPFFGRSPDKYFARWSKKCGPVISARMGVADNVILNDYESIKEAFVKHGDNLSGRPAIKVFEEMSDGHGVVMIDYGERWKSQRQFGITTLRGFGVGRRSMEDRCVEESAYLNEQLLSYGGKPFDVTHVVMNAVANNICSVVFGRRFDYDDDMFRDLIDRATRTFNDPFHSVMINMAILIPWLMYIPPFSTSCKTMLADIHVVLSRMQSIVDQHKTDYDANDIRDFIDKFLQEMKRDDRGHFTNLQLLQYLRDLFQAGTETTTTTLKWALLCLLHYPETQRKLFDEISNVVGNDGEINFTLKARMPYTCAFIQEVYRFRTLVPLCVPHKANRDIELRGFIIPQGTTNLQLLQYLRDLFQAGTETTTTTLKWALLCLLHYPETQRKLFDEISNAIGNDGEINFTLKARMPYTCAFIQEVYRFRTLVPLCVPHKANRDIELRGFIIPQGTTNLQLLQYLRDLFQAGTETTTTTLKWALLCLLHYPETQRKLFDEISNAIGNDGEINFTLKARMPYTCAFIQEVYRFRTLVPLCVPHKANRDIELRGFIIPQGTTVLANLWAVHNDSDTWREPDKFQPERHLDSDGNFSQSCHVIPFSVGPRHCLGEQLARMEIFIFLVAMVQRFEFSPDPGDAGLPVIDDGALGAVFAPAKFKIVATQRK